MAAAPSRSRAARAPRRVTSARSERPRAAVTGHSMTPGYHAARRARSGEFFLPSYWKLLRHLPRCEVAKDEEIPMTRRARSLSVLSVFGLAALASAADTP